MSFEDKILVGITTTKSRRPQDHWKKQLEEVEKLGIKKAAIFPTTLNSEQRKEFYAALEKSGLEEIPLVHIRGQDFTEEELEYFVKIFKTKWFNCHTNELNSMYLKFPRFKEKILLELQFINAVNNRVEPNKLGGFCIDLAHHWAAKLRNYVEYSYVNQRIKNTPVRANHLNGFNAKKEIDIHFISSLKQFDYLKELPKELFSEVIAFEVENSIAAQLRFKEYVVKLLEN